MHVLSVIFASILSLFLSNVVFASHNDGSAFARRRHHVGRDGIENASIERNFSGRSIQKRFSNARFSFFATGLGACGKTNSPSDFIVALDTAQYDGGSHCFETITISYGGKTTQAQIVDECPGCGFGELDFSTGLFTFFAPESTGLIYGEWEFGSTADETTTQAAPTSQTPSTTWTPSSTTHWSTTTSSTTTTTSTSLSSSSSSSSSTWSSSSASPTAIPTASIASSTNTDNGVLAQLNLAFLGIAGIVVEGA